MQQLLLFLQKKLKKLQNNHLIDPLFFGSFSLYAKLVAKIEYKAKGQQKLLKLLNPMQIIALGFFLLILMGSVLLSLPVSSKAGIFTPFTDALFTSASATCVTGLIVYYTGSYWPVGYTFFDTDRGLGFITAAALVSFLIHRKLSIKERLVMVESLNENYMQETVRMTKRTLFIGAAGLS